MLSEHFPLRPKALGIFRVALNAVSSGLQNTQGQQQPSQTLFRVPTVPRLAAVRDLRKGGGVERPCPLLRIARLRYDEYTARCARQPNVSAGSIRVIDDKGIV